MEAAQKDCFNDVHMFWQTSHTLEVKCNCDFRVLLSTSDSSCLCYQYGRFELETVCSDLHLVTYLNHCSPRWQLFCTEKWWRCDDEAREQLALTRQWFESSVLQVITFPQFQHIIFARILYRYLLDFMCKMHVTDMFPFLFKNWSAHFLFVFGNKRIRVTC